MSYYDEYSTSTLGNYDGRPMGPPGGPGYFYGNQEQRMPGNGSARPESAERRLPDGSFVERVPVYPHPQRPESHFDRGPGPGPGPVVRHSFDGSQPRSQVELVPGYMTPALGHQTPIPRHPEPTHYGYQENQAQYGTPMPMQQYQGSHPSQHQQPHHQFQHPQMPPHGPGPVPAPIGQSQSPFLNPQVPMGQRHDHPGLPGYQHQQQQQQPHGFNSQRHNIQNCPPMQQPTPMPTPVPNPNTAPDDDFKYIDTGPGLRTFTARVTQIQDLFGMIGNDIFFQTSNVKGPIPKIGDRVLAESETVFGLPFKWNAKSVQVIETEARPCVAKPSSRHFEPTGLQTPSSSSSSTSMESSGLKSILKKRNPPPPPILSKVQPQSHTQTSSQMSQPHPLDTMYMLSQPSDKYQPSLSDPGYKSNDFNVLNSGYKRLPSTTSTVGIAYPHFSPHPSSATPGIYNAQSAPLSSSQRRSRSRSPQHQHRYTSDYTRRSPSPQRRNQRSSSRHSITREPFVDRDSVDSRYPVDTSAFLQTVRNEPPMHRNPSPDIFRKKRSLTPEARRRTPTPTFHDVYRIRRRSPKPARSSLSPPPLKFSARRSRSRTPERRRSDQPFDSRPRRRSISTDRSSRPLMLKGDRRRRSRTPDRRKRSRSKSYERSRSSPDRYRRRSRSRSRSRSLEKRRGSRSRSREYKRRQSRSRSRSPKRDRRREEVRRRSKSPTRRKKSQSPVRRKSSSTQVPGNFVVDLRKDDPVVQSAEILKTHHPFQRQVNPSLSSSSSSAAQHGHSAKPVEEKSPFLTPNFFQQCTSKMLDNRSDIASRAVSRSALLLDESVDFKSPTSSGIRFTISCNPSQGPKQIAKTNPIPKSKSTPSPVSQSRAQAIVASTMQALKNEGGKKKKPTSSTIIESSKDKTQTPAYQVLKSSPKRKPKSKTAVKSTISTSSKNAQSSKPTIQTSKVVSSASKTNENASSGSSLKDPSKTTNETSVKKAESTTNTKVIPKTDSGSGVSKTMVKVNVVSSNSKDASKSGSNSKQEQAKVSKEEQEKREKQILNHQRQTMGFRQKLPLTHGQKIQKETFYEPTIVRTIKDHDDPRYNYNEQYEQYPKHETPTQDIFHDDREPENFHIRRDYVEVDPASLKFTVHNDIGRSHQPSVERYDRSDSRSRQVSDRSPPSRVQRYRSRSRSVEIVGYGVSRRRSRSRSRSREVMYDDSHTRQTAQIDRYNESGPDQHEIYIEVDGLRRHQEQLAMQENQIVQELMAAERNYIIARGPRAMQERILRNREGDDYDDSRRVYYEDPRRSYHH